LGKKKRWGAEGRWPRGRGPSPKKFVWVQCNCKRACDQRGGKKERRKNRPVVRQKREREGLASVTSPRIQQEERFLGTPRGPIKRKGKKQEGGLDLFWRELMYGTSTKEKVARKDLLQKRLHEEPLVTGKEKHPVLRERIALAPW